jgi:DMSO/TMAO reductase YedYZ molybdopterin-dependent catalytic subunit
MRIVPRSESISRRDFVRGGSALATAAVLGRLANGAADAEPPAASVPTCRPLLTAALDFEDVSRGHPKPYDLTGAALEAARLTPQSWRLEIVADPFTDEHVKEPASLSKQFTIEDGTALDLSALMELGRNHGARFIKAMQCMNLSVPLGQGLWEGVPLREALRLCGSLRNVRRIYYWGFHNNDPGQLFQSSLSFTEVMETAPGELPAFLAYRLNGEPIPLKRGGPVRMIVPWSHGFKSIKWLQRISLTNDFRANDTYANANNDPDSHLKTAAYILEAPKGQVPGRSVTMSGLVISGLSGLRRVEYLLRRVNSAEAATTWPLRYSMISWFVTLKDLKPGNYEFRARSVDLNGFAQPEPRPLGKTGKNAVESARFEVM